MHFAKKLSLKIQNIDRHPKSFIKFKSRNSFYRYNLCVRKKKKVLEFVECMKINSAIAGWLTDCAAYERKLYTYIHTLSVPPLKNGNLNEMWDVVRYSHERATPTRTACGRSE